MLFTLLFVSSSLWAQNLVTEFQDKPLNSFSNECATYREFKQYDVLLDRYVEFSALANSLHLKNGDILINRRIEDHLPYKNPPQSATVVYKITPDGRMERYPFQSKSKSAQALYMGKMVTSENNRYLVSLGDRYLPATDKEYRVAILTDLEKNISTEIFTQSRDALNLVESTFISNEGEVLLTMADAKMIIVKNLVQTVFSGEIPERFTLNMPQNSKPALSSNARDFTGIKTSSIVYQEANMTYVSDTQRLSFMELGQELGGINLNGCRLLQVEEISTQAARLTCDEGIMWLSLNPYKPVSDVIRNIVGFFPCK